MTFNIIESNAGKLAGIFDLSGQDNEMYSGEFEIPPNSQGANRAPHCLDILHQSQCVINRRMGVTRGNGITDTKQLKAALWITHD
jgi:hypothetical protein